MNSLYPQVFAQKFATIIGIRKESTNGVAFEWEKEPRLCDEYTDGIEKHTLKG